MNVYEIMQPGALIAPNPYVGRGIIIGKSPSGRSAAVAYFIMGRSENSRNRVFRREGDAIMIHPFDISKVEDPSLIIYAPVRTYKNFLIVTNGDQTDTVYEGLTRGLDFSEALRGRTFEPDAPNFTPRISGLLHFTAGDFNYSMNILKSADAAGSACNRFTFEYAALPGMGHFLHTYVTDGTPIPTFVGEPERVCIPESADALADMLWGALNPGNRVALYVRYTDLTTGKVTDRIINRHTDENRED